MDYIVKKACKKLYSLRVLRRAGVSRASILKVYLTTIRPALEYTVPVWQSIPDYLNDIIESVQKRALKIVSAEESYMEALGQANLPTLQERREDVCYKYMKKMKSRDHPLFKLLPRPVAGTCNYKLRKSSEKFLLFNGSITCTCRTKRAHSFFTFRYFK